MHSTIAKLSQLERAYLDAVWQYHRENSSELEDMLVSKEVFRLIRAGQHELAAVEAGKNPVTCEIFSMAADAANKKENKNLKILDEKSLALFVKICSNADGQITINHELSSYGGTIGFTMRAKNDAQEYFITKAFYSSLVKKGYLFPNGE